MPETSNGSRKRKPSGSAGSYSKKRVVSKKSKEQETTNAAFARRVALAKPLFLEKFSISKKAEGCIKVWDSMADTEWQKDLDIAAKVLECGLPTTKVAGHAILAHQPSISYLIKNASTIKRRKELWDAMDKSLQKDPQITFEAWERKVPVSLFDKKVIDNPKHLKKGLSKGWLHYNTLPTKHKNDIKLILAASPANESAIAKRFQALVDQVKDQETLWNEWACNHPEMIDKYDGDIWGEAPLSVRSNASLMLQVIAEVPHAIKFVVPALQKDLKFLLSAVEKSVRALAHIKPQTFQQFPALPTVDLIHKYLGLDSRSSRQHTYASEHMLLAAIPSEFWKDRDWVVNTWLAAGGDFHSGLPTALYSDEEAILTFHRHGAKRYVHSFGWIGSDFDTSRVHASLLSQLQFFSKLLVVAHTRQVRWLAVHSPLHQSAAWRSCVCPQTLTTSSSHPVGVRVTKNPMHFR